ncbi:FadR family transcriptional regulator [bacterium 1XD42-54]|nr:FadR family transcriptional regulator [bacterium 1XD42-54]
MIGKGDMVKGTMAEQRFKIVRAKLSEQIADRLEDSILNEEFVDSEKLPSEQFLAEEFQVSKNVIRESLNLLKERGLLETRNGSGNFVTRPKADNLSDVIGRMIVLDNIDYGQIYDTRMILEVSACKRAAQRITQEELDALGHLLEKLEDRGLLVSQRREMDLNFHILIAKASGNHLLVIFIEAMKNIIEGAMFLKRDMKRWESVEESVGFHRRILSALAAHDAPAAEQAMSEHLSTALKNIERIMQEQ